MQKQRRIVADAATSVNKRTRVSSPEVDRNRDEIASSKKNLAQNAEILRARLQDLDRPNELGLVDDSARAMEHRHQVQTTLDEVLAQKAQLDDYLSERVKQQSCFDASEFKMTPVDPHSDLSCLSSETSVRWPNACAFESSQKLCSWLAEEISLLEDVEAFCRRPGITVPRERRRRSLPGGDSRFDKMPAERWEASFSIQEDPWCILVRVLNHIGSRLERRDAWLVEEGATMLQLASAKWCACDGDRAQTPRYLEYACRVYLLSLCRVGLNAAEPPIEARLNAQLRTSLIECGQSPYWHWLYVDFVRDHLPAQTLNWLRGQRKPCASSINCL
jgi:hypothetical protein